MARKLLDREEYRERILAVIESTGKEKGSWQGVCSETTFYDYIQKNSEFSEHVAQAKMRFRKVLWRDRGDLKKLAVVALEANLRPFVQTWKKKIYDIIGGEKALVRIEEIRTEKPPAKWAIEQVLGMNRKDDLMEDMVINVTLKSMDENRSTPALNEGQRS